MLIVMTGASGSGKSEYAEQTVCELAAQDGLKQKLYLATMEKEGAEAGKRIARHRRMREGKGFVTIESPMGLGSEWFSADVGETPVKTAVRREKDSILLLECVSNLLANLMFSGGMSGGRAADEILSQIAKAKAYYRHVAVVTNEIFSEGTQYTGEMGDYICAMGEVNRRLAELSDTFCEVVYGIPVFLKKKAKEERR